MAKLFLDVTPSYPLNEVEFWRVMVAESESGKEVRTTRWNFPRRDWDLSWNRADRTTEKEAILSILRQCKGGSTTFFWKEPYPTSRDDVYIGTGTGSRQIWVLPVWAPSSYSLFVNSAMVYPNSQFTVNSYGSANSQHILTINSPPPASGESVHFSYVSGYYTPLVRQVGEWRSSLIAPGWEDNDIRITIREPKEDMPES